MQCMNLRIRGVTDDAIEAGRESLVIAGEVGDADLAYMTNFYLAAAEASVAPVREAIERVYRRALATEVPADTYPARFPS